MRRRAAAMMNLVAIGLVLSTLTAAGIWSPAPPSPPAAPQLHDDHVVREGRRVVIVEYERETDGTLKERRVLSSLPVKDGEDGAKVLEEARGMIADTAVEVGGAAEDWKQQLSDAKEGATGGGVLGAVKRCKDRLCGAGRRVEEGTKDAAWRVEQGVEDAARSAKETVSGATDSAENKAFDAAQHGKETLESAKDKASQGKETTKGKVSQAASKAKEKASDLEHGAAEVAKGAKDRVSSAAGNVKHGAEDTVRGAKDKVSDMAERAEDKAAEAEEAVRAKAGSVRKNLTDIARRARDVASDAAAYLLGGPMEAARTATAVMHLLGFSTAFGTSVWVTFLSSYVLAAALPRQQLGMLQSKLYPVYFRAMAYGIGLALAAHLLGAEKGSLASRAQSVNLLAALGLVLANMMLLEPNATKVMFERMKVEKEDGRGQDMADIVDPPAVAVGTRATYAAAAARAEAAAARAPTTDGAAATTGKAATPAATTGQEAATAGDGEMSKGRVRNLNNRLKTLNSYSSLCNILSLMALSWHLVHLARRLLPNAC